MATKNSFLFVGGVKDGTRLCVESQRVEFPVLREPRPVFAPEGYAAQMMVPFHRERYEAMRLFGETNEYVVYALDAMNADEVLEALIRNYSGKEKK